MQLVTVGARLVASPKTAALFKASDQTTNRRLVVEDALDVGDVIVGLQDADRDRVLGHIEAEVNVLGETGHGPAPSV